jgi:glycosyltransferase involved in cell wall biosynthesis
VNERPDILHIQSGFSARRDWVMIPLFRKHCGKVVLTAHNVLPHEERERKAAGMGFALGRIYRSCDGIVAHSRRSKEEIGSVFDVEGRRVAVIPHGNYVLFSDMAEPGGIRGELRTPREEGLRVVLFFGHMRAYKGIDVLLRAFSRVRRKRDDVLLILAGKGQGNLVAEYERIIAQEGLADSVVMKSGYLREHEMRDLFAGASLTVFPYRESDGSGAVQLAYAFAKPVVATRVGVLPDIVEEGVNGYLVPPEEPEALADAILRFLALSPADAQKMGSMSRLLAERLYSWEEIARSTLDFYRSLASRRP